LFDHQENHMFEIVAICREFQKNYRSLPAEDQLGLRIKGYAVAVQGILSALVIGWLAVDAHKEVVAMGMNPLIVPTFVVLSLLLGYKLLVYLCRKVSQE
jgi:hypothetical protein